MEAPKLTKVIRLDSVPIEKATFTEEGYMIDRPILTTTGIFEYTNNDGSIRRELRLPEEVFDEESLKSYKGKPIIITHDAGLITKDNVAEEQIGTILTEGYQDGHDVRAEICIHDTNEMKESGLKELSLGYNLELEEEPGVWKGQKYDAIQRNIRINHLALVREARAGESARLNLDGRDNNKNILIGGKKMAKKKATKRSRLDGILSEKELEEAIKQYKARRANSEESKEDEDDEPQAAVNTKKAEAEEKKAPVAKKPAITDKVKAVKETRENIVEEDEDDEECGEDPKKVIAQQDEDIQTLFDIIDTLLAEKDFDAAEPAPSENKPAPEDEDADYVDTDEDDVPEEGEEDLNTDGEDEIPEDEEDPFAEDEDDFEDEDEFEEDEDDEEDPFGGNDFEEDEDDEFEEEDFEEDEDDEEECETEDFIGDGCGKKMNADSVDAIIRTRVKLGLMGQKLNMDGLENLSIKQAKCKIIKKVRPGIRLDGKSAAYINAAYDMACNSINKASKKTTATQKKQMFNKKTARTDGRESNLTGAQAARLRMINKNK